MFSFFVRFYLFFPLVFLSLPAEHRHPPPRPFSLSLSSFSLSFSVVWWVLSSVPFLLHFSRLHSITKQPQVQINKNFKRNIVNIFLPINFNICFGCSKEPSQ